MAELFPLSDLRDPVAFLMGARVPIIQSFRAFHDIEWSRDRLIITLNPDDRRASIDTLRGEVMEIGLSLDLSDPDVARWCDRKIGARRCGRPCYLAVLRAVGGHWDLTTWTDLPDAHVEWSAACLEGIPCDEAHIPTARSALIRALYGKEAT